MRRVTPLSFLLDSVNWNRLSFVGDAIVGHRALSREPETASVNPVKLLKKKTESFTVPPVTEENLRGVSAITGISIGTSHLSWAKFSIDRNPLILDWNARLLPYNFRAMSNESEILKYAYYLKQTIPPSDLYVMETFSIKGEELKERVNEIHLSSMLIVLLNGLNRDPNHGDKVVFQKKNVLDSLYDLLVECERVSSRSATEQWLDRIKSNDREADEGLPDQDSQWDLSAFRISPKCLYVYEESSFAKREDLSIALLLALSFIQVNILKTQETLEKLKKKPSGSVLR